MFLEKNAYIIAEKLDALKIVEIATRVADGQLELKEIADWLRENSIPK